MSQLHTFGDGQWRQALAAVLIGLLLAGSAGHRAGPIQVGHPLQPVGAAIRAVAGGLFEAAVSDVAAIQCVAMGTRDEMT